MLVRAKAKLSSDGSVIASNGKTYLGKRVVVATGSSPADLPHIKADGEKVLNNRDFFKEDQLGYNSYLIIGAGAIGLELAWALNALGKKVYVVEIMDRVVPALDEEAAELLAKELTKQGVKLYLSSSVESIEDGGSSLKVKVKTPSKEELMEVDRVLLAIGRRPNTLDLGLEDVGVELDRKGFVKVDEFHRANEMIFAIGDTTVGASFYRGGKPLPLLAHRAIVEGDRVAEYIVYGRTSLELDNIPSVLYTYPEAAQVGSTDGFDPEDIGVVSKDFSHIGKTMAIGERVGFVKLFYNKRDQRLLKGIIVGPEASELISTVTLALKAKLA